MKSPTLKTRKVAGLAPAPTPKVNPANLQDYSQSADHRDQSRRDFHHAIEAPLREAWGVARLMGHALATIGAPPMGDHRETVLREYGAMAAAVDAVERLTALALDGIDSSGMASFDNYYNRKEVA